MGNWDSFRDVKLFRTTLQRCLYAIIKSLKSTESRKERVNFHVHYGHELAMFQDGLISPQSDDPDRRSFATVRPQKNGGIWGHPEPKAQFLCKTKYVQKNKLYYFQKKRKEKGGLEIGLLEIRLGSETAGLLTYLYITST